MAPQAKAGDSEKSQIRRMVMEYNGKPGNEKKEGVVWNGYGNNKDWNTGMKQ